MADLPSPDLLMFVGRSHYDEQSFIAEIRSMGASKRVARFPYEAGYDSQIWFAMHGVPKMIQEMFPSATGIVFCKAFIDRFEKIMDDEDIDDALEDVGAKVRTELLSFSDISGEGERGCGFRHPGKYILTSTDVAEITVPMPISIPHFRGYRYINPDLMSQVYADYQHGNFGAFSPPNIYSICDQDQLSTDELLQLHVIQMMKKQRGE